MGYCVHAQDFEDRPALYYLLENHVLASRDPDAWASASPVNSAKKLNGVSAIVILHGTADTMSPITDSRALRATLEKTLHNDARVLYIEVPSGPHGWDYFESGITRKYAGLASDFVLSAFTQKLSR